MSKSSFYGLVIVATLCGWIWIGYTGNCGGIDVCLFKYITGIPCPACETTHTVHYLLEVARSVQLMKLSHAVITSVDRDDLEDMGASHWVKTLRKIKELNPAVTVEALIPDFQGNLELVKQVASCGANIVSHNMETVKRLTPVVRSVARYETSLEVIRAIAETGVTAKSGIMVGLGETVSEVEELMDDLLEYGCRILTIGQYLQPTHKHYPVKEYVTPQQFEAYKELGLKKGFAEVVSGPLVRSSYHAEKQLKFCKTQ
mgnify:CR=1 FL=1